MSALHAWIGVALVVTASAACSSTTSAPTGGNTTADGGGGVGPGTGTSTAKTACQLMLRADAEAAVGQPLSENVEDKVLDTCQYTTADFAAGAQLSVSTWTAIKTAETSNNETPTAVSGVGDEAYSNGSLFFVRRGSDGFLLDLNGPMVDHAPDQRLAQEKILASKILANF